MSAMLRRARALGRYGALTRPMLGKPRGTRARAADRKEPVPGHYFWGTPAWFTVLDEPLQLEIYVEAMQMSLADDMRRAAVHVVAEFGDATHVAPLATILHEDTCEVMRWSAAAALATIGGPAAEASLWRALESADQPPGTREAALRGILDLLTPAGWENYTFMNPTRIPLPADVHARLAHVRDAARRSDLAHAIDRALACFDSEHTPAEPPASAQTSAHEPPVPAPDEIDAHTTKLTALATELEASLKHGGTLWARWDGAVVAASGKPLTRAQSAAVIAVIQRIRKVVS